MIKKFTRNVYICDLPRNFSEAVTKENLQFTKKIQIWNKACPDKSLMWFNYWFNQMEKHIAAAKIFWLT